MKTLLIAAGLTLAAGGTAQAATLYGPSGYLSSADSPFAGLNLQNFVLEDFESGAQPGYTASAGGRVTGSSVDSVAPGSWSHYSFAANAVEFSLPTIWPRMARCPPMPALSGPMSASAAASRRIPGLSNSRRSTPQMRA